MADRHLTLRVTPELHARLRGRAEQDGLSLSAWIRAKLSAALDEPAAADDSEIADRRETLALLTRAARMGDVTAMKALLAATEPGKQASTAGEAAAPRSPLDELAARRQRGA
ncbi:plasmid mobilization protein [Miltoncostaea marina]|uniref:plasmid mobilization protein n=1 Tax=Miltoncostaea marina TaxID=2843215 RepID=UPI001C3E58AA|nr:toxin-antitoxin system HicB family antitoxin [Miltoncostaea marina]